MSDTINYTTELGPLVEGESIAYSFQVPGWHMVLGLLLLAVLVTGLLYLIRYMRNAYRRDALREVEHIMEEEAGGWTYGIGLLLKNLAMEKFDKMQVASLQGREWYSFLRSSSKPDPRFSDADFKTFEAYTYNARVPDRELGEKLGDFARHWIRTHHAGRI